LLGLRSNSGNSFIHDINDLDRVCDEFNALVLWAIEAIYISMRRILVLALRLQLVNRSVCLSPFTLRLLWLIRNWCLACKPNLGTIMADVAKTTVPTCHGTPLLSAATFGNCVQNGELTACTG
jgi:hypothetical protein